MRNRLLLSSRSAVRAQNAGLFVSRGSGRHQERIIDSYEIIFVESGRFGMYESDVRFDLESGDALILYPGRKHGGTDDYPDELRYYWIHFSLSEEHGEDAFAVPQRVTLNEPERLLWLFRRFLDDQENGHQTVISASACVTMMLCEIELASRLPRPGGSVESVLSQNVDEIVRTRFSERLSTASIAAELYYTPDHIARAYRKTFHRSIVEALHLRRIHHARGLLLNSGKNINEIGDACGFGDPAYFRKVFKRSMGVTPGQYRRMFARMHINTE